MKDKQISTPTNRISLLKDRLKTRFWDFISVSLLITIFLLPLIIWNMSLTYSDSFVMNEDNYLLTGLIVFGPYIIFIMIFGLGITGALYYSKRLAFGEGANTVKDFFYGIKINLKSSLIGFFILGLFYFLLAYGKIIIIYNGDLNEMWKGVVIGLLYVAFIFIFLIISFYLTQNIIYKATFNQYISNSIRFTFGMAGWNMLILLVVLFPFFIYEFVPFALARYIAIGIAALFYFEFSVFVFSIYSHAIFDLTINDDYPEIYRKGLSKEDNLEN